MTFDLQPALTPAWLAVAGTLFLAHGGWQWLTADDRADDHRRSIDSGEERFYEHAPRAATPAGVERWAKLELLVGAAFLAAAAALAFRGGGASA